jgi:hypothetical protein
MAIDDATEWIPLPDSARAGFANDRRADCAGRDLLEQLQPLSAQRVLELGETGGIAARPRKACNVTTADRIEALHEHNRYAAARLLNQRHDSRRSAADHNEIGRERKHLRSLGAKARGFARGPADVDLYIVTDNPARLPQPLNKGIHAQLRFRIVRPRAHEQADVPHAVYRLRACR